MRIHPFLLGWIACALLAPAGAAAQGTARLGILGSTQAAQASPQIDAFLKRLAELGWVQGKNLIVERRVPGNPGELPALAAELVALKPGAVLAAGSPATSAAAAATKSVPIVMVAFNDPVAAGIVRSLARPGGNVTGMTIGQTELYVGKRLEILTQAMPKLRRVAVFWDASVRPPEQAWFDGVDAEARRVRLQLDHLQLRSLADFEEAFRKARGAGAVMVMDAPLFSSGTDLIAAHGLKHRLPVMTLFSFAVERGAFLSYGPSLSDLFVRAALQVDKILRGTAPAAIPVEEPATFELVLNRKTAQALGVQLPASFLQRVDRVIE